MKRKIKNALISVSDKSELGPLLKVLKKFKIKIISSGGTYKAIKKLKYSCIDVSEFTNFNEMLDGRVKTLHPKIHAGILFDRSKKKHINQMDKEGFDPIDLLIINFYPFQETLQKTVNPKTIVENIDIGGPTMVRAAAKNFKSVTVITNKNDYSKLINELNTNRGKVSLNFREELASKAFDLTAYYDSMVSEWFHNRLNIKFPEFKTFFGKKIKKLRYGENPHQEGSMYLSDVYKNDLGLKILSGKELSYNNYNDLFAGLDILISENKLSSTVIIKHANPCGVSSDKSSYNSFIKAQASDPISAFGGVVVCNYRINKKIANEISKTFFEIVMAKGFEKKALNILKKKKNMRVIDISNFKFKSKTSVKIFDNSFLLQEKDNIVLSKNKLKIVTKNKPTNQELKEIEFAYRVCKYVKSNAIVLTKEKATIGIGAGQQNRLDSCKIAVKKAKEFQPKKILNSTAASDAFFPFPDGLKTLINSGVKLIVQPGGSIRDKEVIEAANKAGIKMVFTGIRHFNH